MQGWGSGRHYRKRRTVILEIDAGVGFGVPGSARTSENDARVGRLTRNPVPAECLGLQGRAGIVYAWKQE